MTCLTIFDAYCTGYNMEDQSESDHNVGSEVWKPATKTATIFNSDRRMRNEEGALLISTRYSDHSI